MTEDNSSRHMYILELELELDTTSEPRRRYQYESCESLIGALNRFLEDIHTGRQVTQIGDEFIMIKNIVSFKDVSE